MRNILGSSNLIEGITKILVAGTSSNGVFGAKIHWSHFRFLGMSVRGEWSARLRTSMYDQLRAQLPILVPRKVANDLLTSRFQDMRVLNSAYGLLESKLPGLRVIWIRRKNMVARAISHYRAAKSGVWYQVAGSSRSQSAEEPPEFDIGEIHTRYLAGVFQEEHWRRFFDYRRISPLCFTYEELVADYESTLRRVLQFLEIDASELQIPTPRSAKQSDAVSEEWERRYRDAVPDIEEETCESQTSTDSSNSRGCRLS